LGRLVSGRLRLLTGVGLVVALVLLAPGSWAAASAVDWSVDPVAFAGALGLLVLAPLGQAVTLGVALRALGADAPALETLRVWARSFLLRYEPTGTAGFVYRVRRRERLGASTPQVLAASGYEQLAAVTAGAAVALGAFVGAGARPPVLACVLALALGAAALASRPAWLGDRLARWVSRRGMAVAGPLPGRTLGLMVAVNCAGWAATGAGVWLLAQGLLGPGQAPGVLVLLGAFALAWVVGVLTPLLPGGLGPRDAALTVALTPVIGPGRAAVLAIALRAATVAAEVLAAAAAEGGAWVLARRRPGARHRGAGVPEPPLAPAAAPAPALAGDGPPAAAGPRGGGGRTIVVVPTYNEREVLALFVERFAAGAPRFELLVVDDDSPDATGALADALAAGRPWMHVLHRPGKDGLGNAYRAGFRWCLEAGFEVIGQMDCDLSHPPEALPGLRAVLVERDAGLVLGSRYAPGGKTDGWSRTRLAVSRVGCRASRLVLDLPFSDLSGGFKLWRAECLAGLDLDAMLSAGYAFQIETTQLAHLAGARIEEVPFVFSERVAGSSKMTLGISLEGIRVTLALRRRRGRPGGRRLHGAC
jgi:dolichol-phosphate mannosyltransferase